jgi:hypothetical protein
MLVWLLLLSALAVLVLLVGSLVVDCVVVPVG